jgi:hypothetical protein
MEVAGGSRWSPDRRRVTRTRVAVDHCAIVRSPAFVGAGVVGVREATAVAENTLRLLAMLRGHG